MRLIEFVTKATHFYTENVDDSYARKSTGENLYCGVTSKYITSNLNVINLQTEYQKCSPSKQEKKKKAKEGPTTVPTKALEMMMQWAHEGDEKIERERAKRIDAEATRHGVPSAMELAGRLRS